MSAVITITVDPRRSKVGDTIRIYGRLLVNSLPVDPTTFRITVTDPGGVGEDFIWPSNVLAVQEETGKWYVDVDVDEKGLWRVECASTGTGFVSVARLSFIVDPVTEQLRVHVVDQDNNPLQDVTVMAWDPGRNQLFASGDTDADGYVSLSLLPRDYVVSCDKARTAFSNPYDVTVADTGGETLQDMEISGETLAITTTAKPKVVHLFGHILSPAGEFLRGERVIVETVSYGRRAFLSPETGTDTAIDAQPVMVSAGKVEAVTAEDGYWEVKVTAGTIVRVSIPSVRFERIFRVPLDVTVLNIRDARPDPGAGAGVGIDSDHGGRDTLEGPGAA